MIGVIRYRQVVATSKADEAWAERLLGVLTMAAVWSR